MDASKSIVANISEVQVVLFYSMIERRAKEWFMMHGKMKMTNWHS